MKDSCVYTRNKGEFTMDEDVVDLKPDMVKLESELILDDHIGTDYTFTAPDPEDSLLTPVAVFLEEDPVIAEKNELQSEGKLVSILRRRVAIKQEVTEDGTLSTDPLADTDCWDLPKIVPITNHQQNNLVSQNEITMKFNGNFQENYTIKKEPSQSEFMESNEENWGKETCEEMTFDIPSTSIAAVTNNVSSESNKRVKRNKVDLSSSMFQKPFDFGWKREVVYQATQNGKQVGYIYYLTPSGKRLRSTRKIQDHLVEPELSINNFTFRKKPLGVNVPSKEIIRDARTTWSKKFGAISQSQTGVSKLKTNRKSKLIAHVSRKFSPKAAIKAMIPNFRQLKVVLTRIEDDPSIAYSNLLESKPIDPSENGCCLNSKKSVVANHQQDNAPTQERLNVKSRKTLEQNSVIMEEQILPDLMEFDEKIRIKDTSYSSTNFSVDCKSNRKNASDLFSGETVQNFTSQIEDCGPNFENPISSHANISIPMSEFDRDLGTATQHCLASFTSVCKNSEMKLLKDINKQDSAEATWNEKHPSNEHCSTQLTVISSAQEYSSTPPDSAQIHSICDTATMKDETVTETDTIVTTTTISRDRIPAQTAKSTYSTNHSVCSGKNLSSESSTSCEQKLCHQKLLLAHSNDKRFPSDQYSALFRSKKKLKSHSVIHSVAKLFFCDQCSARFKTKSHLERHLVKHSDVKPFSCDHCSYTCKRKKTLQVHLLTHSSERPFSCTHCLYTFKRIENLNVHLLSHSNERFSCSHCVYTCKRKEELKMHMLSHSNGPLPDDHSMYTYKRKEGLKMHLLSHSNEIPFSCDHRSARFKKSAELEQHLVVHSDARLFSCNQCSAQFKTIHHLKQHLRIHFPLSCDHCSARFKKSAELEQHLVTHSGARLFSCNQCSAQFKTIHDLKQHSLIHLPFSCNQCSARFKQINDLNLHSLIHFPFICDHCYARFKKSAELELHLVTHSAARFFSCNQCSAQFKEIHDLKQHSLIHFPFPCDHCSAGFKKSAQLIQHLLTHSGERFFSCNQCSAKFKKIHDLKQHSLIHFPFRCDHCSARFEESAQLIQHLLTHSGARFFSCNQCSAKFKKIHDLKQHSLIHLPFSCNQCSAQFKKLHVLKQHSLIHFPFRCDHCSARFEESAQLIQHLVTHSGARFFSCNQCSAKFKKIHDLKQHSLIHLHFSCNQCSAQFEKLQDLKQHSLIHFPFRCDHCSAEFEKSAQLIQHLVTHSGARFFSCNQCSAKFKKIHDLKQHSLLIHLPFS